MKQQHVLRSSIHLAVASALSLASMTAFAGNTVTGNYAAANGDQNTASGNYSVVGGGSQNTASGNYSAVGGGWTNWATNWYSWAAGYGNNSTGYSSTVAGGTFNKATGQESTVVGGLQNIASGQHSTAAGGMENQAGGDQSFAGGTYAVVRNAAQAGNSSGDQGTFIWSDAITTTITNPPPCGFSVLPPCTTTGTPSFTSTGPNQFLVRANGGFGLNGAPVNAQVAMTIQAPASNAGYANIFMHQANSTAGILLTEGDASASNSNDAAFHIDQYNGSVQTRRMTIDGVGNFIVSGQAYKPGGGSWAASSDARLKKNVQPLSHALDRLLALRGVTFEYAQPDANMHPEGTFTGFIAQEVQQAFPNWIGHDARGYLTVGPQGFEALTVEALREIKHEDDARITKLESDNAELRAQMAQQLKIQQGDMAQLQKQVAALSKALDGKSTLAAASAERTLGR
jgi:hypothetical protein